MLWRKWLAKPTTSANLAAFFHDATNEGQAELGPSYCIEPPLLQPKVMSGSCFGYWALATPGFPYMREDGTSTEEKPLFRPLRAHVCHTPRGVHWRHGMGSVSKASP